MTITEGGISGQQAVTSRRPAAPDARGRHKSLPPSAIALCAAAGVLVVAAAYTAGRLGYASSPWADRAYWLGQALILVPVASRLLSRHVPSPRTVVPLVVVLAVAEYLVKVCYSPAAFTYIDELEHWRSTVDLLRTGTLFTANDMLPISPYYPGLEETTSALVSITGLPVFTSGLIVAGAAHLLFVCLLYLLFRNISRSPRVGGIAVLCYAGNSLFTSFDSMFVYQTLALPFLGVTVLAAWHLSRTKADGQRAGWLVVAAAAILAAVITHHVTSYALVVTLLLIAVASVLLGNWRSAGWPAALALIGASAAAGWLVFAAPETAGYLRPVADGVVQSFRSLLAAGRVSGPPTSTGPAGNRALSAAAVVTTSLLVPAGWYRVWQRYYRQPWAMAMAIGSLSWYAIVALRLVVPDGSELAGRASTFVFVPAACMAALALARLADAPVRWRVPAAAVALAAVLTMMFDGLANGWPPYWERLPGPYQVAGSERSVGPEGIAAARWSLAALGPGNRFAADAGNYQILGSYGDQNPVLDVGYLYTSPVYTRADALRARAQSVRYILVDGRMSRSLPASGSYFPIDHNTGRYTRPIPADDLTKFARTPGVSRLYDSGNIVIYDLGG